MRNSLVIRVLALTIVCGSVPAFGQRQSAPPDSPLRAGDRVVVWVPADSLRRDSLVVDDAGFVVLPRVGRIGIGLVPSREVPDTIRARYRRIFRVDDVYALPLRRVSVLGEVKKPGTYFLDRSETLRDAVAAAGGVTEIGNPCCIVVVRDGARRTYRGWQTLAPEELNLASGDAIVVEREAWLKRNALSALSGAAILISTIVTLRR